MLRIRELLFDDWNEEHIARHDVIPEEVEEVCGNRPYVSKTRQQRLRVKGVFYPITARDATHAERRSLKRKK